MENKSIFSRKWGNEGFDDGQFNYPHGLVVGSNGNVYVADTNNHRIQCFDSNGKFICKWGKRGDNDGEFNLPNGFAISFDQVNNITDSIKNAMMMVPELASYPWKDYKHWKLKNNNFNIVDEPLSGLLSICVSYIGTEHLYVVEYGNNRIQVFDVSDLGFDLNLKSISRDELNSVSSRYGSDAKDINELNNAKARDEFNSSKARYKLNNDKARDELNSAKFIRKWGTCGSGDGQFYHPWSCDIGYELLNRTSSKIGSLGKDKVNVIYVTDSLNHRIQVFHTDGRFIGKWGSAGDGDYQFKFPQGICLGYNKSFASLSESRIIISDRSESRIIISDRSESRIIISDRSESKINSSARSESKINSSARSESKINSSAKSDNSVSQIIYIADIGNRRIICYETDGLYQRSSEDNFNINNDSLIPYRLGEIKFVRKFISTPGLFYSPSDLIVNDVSDGVSVVYVVDRDNHCIRQFRKDGTLTEKWGSYGSGDGQFDTPCGIAKGITRGIYGSVSEKFVMYIADTFNSRIVMMNV